MKIRMLKKFFGQYIILGLFVSFLVFSIITGFISQFRKINDYKSEIEEINNQIENTKEEISELKNNVADNDLESVARNQLGMIKLNEIIYVEYNERDN